MDIVFICREILAPIFIALADFVVVPYFFARMGGLIFNFSYEVKSLLVRYSFVLFAFLRVVAHSCCDLVTFVTRLHNEIRDSRYLVGTELRNR